RCALVFPKAWCSPPAATPAARSCWHPTPVQKPGCASNKPMMELAARLDAELPQTQCGRCGFGGCRPYAEAMARGESPINRCPPGGTPTMERLADLLGVAVQALDPHCGSE